MYLSCHSYVELSEFTIETSLLENLTKQKRSTMTVVWGPAEREIEKRQKTSHRVKCVYVLMLSVLCVARKEG